LKSIGDTKSVLLLLSPSIPAKFSTVLFVPFGDLTEGETNRILVPVAEGGLEADSLATCDNILAE